AVVGRELLEWIRAAVRPGARIVPVPAPALFLAALGGELAGMVSGRPIAINRRRYAELTAEGFVCRVDRLRDRLGVVAYVDLAQETLPQRNRAWFLADQNRHDRGLRVADGVPQIAKPVAQMADVGP